MRLKRPTVLVVDIEECIRKSLAGILKLYGYRALTAENMREVAQLIVQRDVDLVVTEDELADGSGVELCRQMKVMGRFHGLPFYFVDGTRNST